MEASDILAASSFVNSVLTDDAPWYLCTASGHREKADTLEQTNDTIPLFFKLQNAESRKLVTFL